MGRLRGVLLAVVLLVFGVASLLFVLENHQPATLVVLGWAAPSMPLAVMLLSALVFGLVLGVLVALFGVLRKR